MRALVTGGAGFIGSTLVESLSARGDDVLVVDDLSAGTRDNLAPGVTVAELDVRDTAALTALAAEYRPDAVFHLAAQIDVRRSMADPVHDASVNVLGTLSVLQAARDAGAGAVVVCSTGGAIYGDIPEGQRAGAGLPVLPGHRQSSHQRDWLALRPLNRRRYRQRLEQAQQRPALLAVFQIKLSGFPVGQQPVVPGNQRAFVITLQRLVLAQQQRNIQLRQRVTEQATQPVRSAVDVAHPVLLDGVLQPLRVGVGANRQRRL